MSYFPASQGMKPNLNFKDTQ